MTKASNEGVLMNACSRGVDLLKNCSRRNSNSWQNEVFTYG